MWPVTLELLYIIFMLMHFVQTYKFGNIYKVVAVFFIYATFTKLSTKEATSFRIHPSVTLMRINSESYKVMFSCSC